MSMADSKVYINFLLNHFSLNQTKKQRHRHRTIDQKQVVPVRSGRAGLYDQNPSKKIGKK